MIRTSETITLAPEVFVNETQRRVYGLLERLEIPFARIDNDPALTMEDCVAIDAALGVPTVKTLLLCNRQQTLFYLYVMPETNPSAPRTSVLRSRFPGFPSPRRKNSANSWVPKWAPPRR